MNTSNATAILFEGTGSPLNQISATLPELQPGEVLVEILATTLCGSDLHTFHGRRETATPAILGHEIIGRVVEVSAKENVRTFEGERIKVGDRVTWSLCVNCGECFYCEQELPQKCEHLLKYGHQSFVLNPWCGGLASHIILRPHTTIFKIPDTLADAAACPANCATATVAAALREAGTITGANVVILGAGMLGLTACAMTREAGAEKVILIDRVQRRLERAEAFGATDVIAAETLAESDCANILSLTAGRGPDVVLELTGVPELCQAGLGLLRVGGRLILVGSVFPTEPVQVFPEQIVRRMLQIKGVHNYRPDDLATALQFLAKHAEKYPFAGLVEAVFPLGQVTAAFDAASTGQYFRVMVNVSAGDVTN